MAKEKKDEDISQYSEMVKLEEKKPDLVGRVKEVFCEHPAHSVNVTKLYVPPGHQFRHTCPACGCKTIVNGPNPYYKG